LWKRTGATHGKKIRKKQPFFVAIFILEISVFTALTVFKLKNTITRGASNWFSVLTTTELILLIESMNLALGYNTS
jgi:hypothetical protein